MAPVGSESGLPVGRFFSVGQPLAEMTGLPGGGCVPLCIFGNK